MSDMKKIYTFNLKILSVNWDRSVESDVAFDDMLCIIDEVCNDGYSIINDPDDACRAEKIGMNVEWVIVDDYFIHAIAR